MAKFNIVDVKKAPRKLRIGVFGKESTGKTHFALSGPGPVICLDAEGRNTAFKDTHNFSLVLEDPVKSFVPLLQAARGGELGCGTLVIDSWTAIEKAFRTQLGIHVNLSDSAKSGKAFKLADQRRQIEDDLLAPALVGPTACHIVAIAHEANMWGAGDGEFKTTGFKPEATRSFGHYFDLVFHLSYDRQNGRRVATVHKSNYPSFAIGRVIPDFSWDTLKDLTSGDLAPLDVTVDELVGLHERAGKPDATLGRWLVANGFDAQQGKKLAPDELAAAKTKLLTLIDAKEAA
jgi:hypothetical protein